MARINLLPWREWERERKKNEFLVRLGGSFVVGLLLVLAGGWYLDHSIQNQNARNQFIKDKITILDQQIAEIRDLRAKREQLLARMRVIQELQGNRPVIVRVFDELVRTLAKGVYFTSVQLKDHTLSIDGTAESNNRISSEMRNLDGSQWFKEPNLKGIKENADAGAQASNFQMTVVQTSPKAAGAQGAEE
ncbi:MAG TPA: PilN domain-containing protein [Pseudomonadales bacterium]|nr:PilN domain-containing protein [Pseudomonadales bacterium]